MALRPLFSQRTINFFSSQYKIQNQKRNFCESGTMSKVYGLLVIDMAQGDVYPDNKCIVPKPMFENILKLSGKLPKERVLDSRLWMSPNDNSSLAQLYEGGRANTPGAKPVADLNGLNGTFVKKVQYSAFFESELDKLLKAQGVTDIILTGIHTDVCVLASALDAFYLRYKVHLVKDACWSVGGEAAHKSGMEKIETLLESYCNSVTTADLLKSLK